MISVDEARARLLGLAVRMPSEVVPLARAGGRALAEDVVAPRAQPPFAASAMDGYAVAGPGAGGGASHRVVGEAAAGRPFAGRLAAGEAVRIFTGAPLPEGADRVLIQEEARRTGDAVAGDPVPEAGAHVRPAGVDFEAGHVLAAGRALRPAEVALAAAMGVGAVRVARRPEVAILMTGDELAAPGGPLPEGGIFASNGYGLAAMLAEAGAAPRVLPVARDHPGSLAAGFRLAAGADLLVTIGGASVGDHDLVAGAAGEAGLDLAFHKVRMRPGKPLLAGRLGGMAMVGLPGNPVSAMVCGVIFVIPMVRAMLGLAPGPAVARAVLGAGLAANGPREHYMRARTEAGRVVAVDRQDSSLLTRLAEADCLIRRPVDDPARAAGDAVEVVSLAGADVPRV